MRLYRLDASPSPAQAAVAGALDRADSAAAGTLKAMAQIVWDAQGAAACNLLDLP
jgi:hypothetical protein